MVKVVPFLLPSSRHGRRDVPDKHAHKYELSRTRSHLDRPAFYDYLSIYLFIYFPHVARLVDLRAGLFSAAAAAQASTGANLNSLRSMSITGATIFLRQATAC